MTIDVRHGRCGRVFLILSGSFDAQAADSLHDALASSDPARPVIVDFREVRVLEPFALAAFAIESQVPGRRLSMLGLSPGHRRLLSDLARQPWN